MIDPHAPQTAQAAQAERKLEKKQGKIMRHSMFAVGAGVGLFFLKFLVIPLLGLQDNPEAVAVIGSFSLFLIFYGAVPVLTFIFKRDWLFKATFVMRWVIAPLIIAKFAMDLMH